MAIAEVGSGSQRSGTQRSGEPSGALVLTYPANTTTGNFLSLVVASDGAASMSVSDNKGNTWSLAGSNASGSQLAEIWYCANATGGASHQVTVTPNVACFLSAVIDEFSVDAASITLDQTAVNSASGTSVSSGSVTTAAGGELYIVALDEDLTTASLSPSGSGWTNAYTHPATSVLEGISFVFQIAPAGTYSESWTSAASITGVTVIASFKAASGGGGGPWPWFLDSAMSGGFSDLGI